MGTLAALRRSRVRHSALSPSSSPAAETTSHVRGKTPPAGRIGTAGTGQALIAGPIFPDPVGPGCRDQDRGAGRGLPPPAAWAKQASPTTPPTPWASSAAGAAFA